jgi:ketosteroid isomerase-like protein
VSPTNIDSAHQVFAALGRRDPESLVALAAPEVEWHSLFALGNVYRGYDGTRQYMRDLTDAWEIGRADVDDTLGVGDVVLAVGRIHYRGKESGVESETPTGWVLEFRHGKLVRFRAFTEPEQVFGAAGIQE